MFVVNVQNPGDGSAPVDDRLGWAGSTYIKSIDFVLKIGVLVFSLIGVICSHVSKNTTQGYYEFHAYSGIILTTALLCGYLFRLVYRLRVAWHVFETLYCGFMGLLYLIGMICMFAAPWYIGGSHGASIAAGVFALFAVLCFAFDAFIKFRLWQSGSLGPGQSSMMTTSAGVAAKADTAPGAEPEFPAY